MTEKTAIASKGKAADRYWERRLRSREFKKGVVAAIARELVDLSTCSVEEVVDAKHVREALGNLSFQTLDQRFVVDLVVRFSARFESRMRQTGESLSDLLGPGLSEAARMTSGEEFLPSGSTEKLITETLRQEFVQSLLVDLIHTAIVSFYKRVNPIFGGITASVLEDQIRGFIRLFLPMLQAQAVAFAMRRSNQQLLLEFTRSIVGRVLDEPLANLTPPVSPAQKRKIEDLVRETLKSSQLEVLLRDALLAAWDDWYKAARRKKVRDIVDFETRALRLAERGAEIVLPVLSRPSVLRLIADEATRAALRR